MKKLEMVITDLDRTLLNDDRLIGAEDLKTLKELKNKGIYRVIATGRSLYTALKVLPESTPIDYLIFSSGAGIINWKSREIMFSDSLIKNEISEISNVLLELEVDFMLHDPIPENHHFTYYHTGKENPDFSHRCEIYREFSREFDHASLSSEASQFIVIIPNLPHLLSKVTAKLKKLNIQIIRATSPLDHQSVWLEIFPAGISKGHSIEWLCNILKVEKNKTLGIGNDYNDLEMLEWTEYSYVVTEAPDDLKARYSVTGSYNYCGFSEAVLKYLKE